MIKSIIDRYSLCLLLTFGSYGTPKFTSNSDIDVAYKSKIELSIDDDFALNIAPSAGLRNRLIHEYEKIDDSIVYKSIDKAILQYSEYMIKIKDFIKV